MQVAFRDLLSFSSYMAMFSRCKRHGLDMKKGLVEYVNQIDKKAAIERIHGSKPEDAAQRKQLIQDMMNALHQNA